MSATNHNPVLQCSEIYDVHSKCACQRFTVYDIVISAHEYGLSRANKK